jgi:phosphoglycerate dehydrogenase-like enzyme
MGMQHVKLEGLKDVLPQTDVLVNLLPLTDQTRGIINAPLLQCLKHGATFINAARGAHLVEEDLLQALDSGVPCRFIQLNHLSPRGGLVVTGLRPVLLEPMY